MRVLHVTESFASGVLDLLATITARQVDEGAAVTIVYATRPDTPPKEALIGMFDPRVTLTEASGRETPKAAGLIRLRSTLRKELASNAYDAIHLHSTIAGVLGRIALGRPGYASRIFYSPHGFAFLRQDLNRISRRIALAVERLAARTGSLVLTTDSELEIARRNLPHSRTALVVNGIDVSALPCALAGKNDRVRVAMVGRITHQKAPWVFARIAESLADKADFTWYGDGSSEDKSRWPLGERVSVVSWMPLSELRQQLARTDIFLFPTLWEGMPLSLIEAQAIGVPAVATRIVGNMDIVVDGTTGWLCDTELELLERTRELIDDHQLRIVMNENALKLVRSRFDDRDIGKKTLSLYGAETVEQ